MSHELYLPVNVLYFLKSWMRGTSVLLSMGMYCTNCTYLSMYFLMSWMHGTSLMLSMGTCFTNCTVHFWCTFWSPECMALACCCPRECTARTVLTCRCTFWCPECVELAGPYCTNCT
jgi:hypothetical protein